MQLGFVSAIFPDLSLEEVMTFAHEEGFACVELMCWPPGGSTRRYAGVTHIDATSLTEQEALAIRARASQLNVTISGLGYYPNPLDPDPVGRDTVVTHLKKVIQTAPLLGVGVVNTFIGRDPSKSIDDNWPMMQSVWTDIMAVARAAKVKIGIENCPMLFSKDEWPGGKNLAINPVTWRRLFAEFGDDLGLNFDPSHLILQSIDCPRAVREFGKKFFHVHAKDLRIDGDKLYEQGTLGLGWSTPKLPGLGDVDWTAFFSALTDAGYNGPVCVEVEDRAYERSLDDRKRSLRQSKRFLEQYVA